ncbi:TetR/AcrR family transcriptional regulator [soil metagenome]
MSAEERREQLLDVATELVGEQGFHAVSIEAVARRAGISRPIVYKHFGDLATLLEAMLEREAERALGQLGEVIPSELASDRAQALLAVLRGYLETVRADPITWRLVLMPPEGAPETLREQITQGRDAVVAILSQLVGSGLGGAPRPPDPELTARMISAIADEGARLMLTDPERFPIDRVINQAAWMLEQLDTG